MRSTTMALAVLCGVLGVTMAAQNPPNPMKPGQWEVTMAMEMANMPKAPETKITQCITPEQVKNPGGILPSGGGMPPAGSGCKVSDQKSVGNTMSWKVSCPAPQKMDGTAEFTFKEDTYTGKMTVMNERGTMTMKYSGRRLGDCK